ncbi:ileal sodium/bile acid cotransporter-like [Mya arenaria]|uniref:ileal sodium/bile acid cotransporter-like n=1 Tax=Mya arenaria TaxID=6604 RepID=UPI0022E8AF1D|nr:ileal sodium/bile acid cotransporter-like [Mya arenaria]XP_052818561.1 ileal sodium/bile acid cotransporter-like [Mya arenaria]
MACPVKTFIFFVLNCLLSLYGSVSANKTSAYGAYGVEVTSHQEFPVLVMENYEKMLSFTLRNFRGDVLEIVPVMENPEVAEMEMNSSETLQPHETKNFTAKVKAKFLGRTKLKLFVNTSQVTEHDMYEIASTGAGEPLEWYEQPETYEVTVSRDESPLSHAFTGTVIILVCLANIAMGCKTELAVVKEVLRRPTGPLTGMFSQFILMPMIALAVIFAFRFDSANALGFFAMACSPGGAASNAYTYLLDGDVSLSVTMTLCSTLLSLGMIPLWLFTVGSHVLNETDVKIPYTNILTSLVGLIIPVALGMLLQWRKPNWAKYVVRGIRPLMVIFFIFVFTVGVYSNLYIFTLMRNKPEILLAGALVPYVGFIFGGLVAIVTRQSWERVRTISIETGIQNTGIAIVLLKVSLPSPDSDLSIVAPIASAIFTPIPMLVAIIWYEIYKRCYKKKKEVYIDDHEGESDVESGVEGEYHRHDNCYVELKENNNLHNGVK